jgi:hypothetical protein
MDRGAGGLSYFYPEYCRVSPVYHSHVQQTMPSLQKNAAALVQSFAVRNPEKVLDTGSHLADLDLRRC